MRKSDTRSNKCTRTLRNGLPGIRGTGVLLW